MDVDVQYCRLLNIVHPQYYLQCFQCENELNHVAPIVLLEIVQCSWKDFIPWTTNQLIQLLVN